MKRPLLIGIVVLTVFIILAIKRTYDWAPNNARNNSGVFAKECDSLNGKPFTYENISAVNGYYDLNGKDRISQKDVDQFVKQNTEQKVLRIYKDSWFKGPNIKYSWICEIKYNKDISSINSSASFYQTD